MKKRFPIVHIKRAGFGKQPALCGARPKVMCSGGAVTCTCKRCLRAPGVKSDRRKAKKLIASLK